MTYKQDEVIESNKLPPTFAYNYLIHAITYNNYFNIYNMTNQEIFNTLNESDFKTLERETGADLNYIKMVLNETLSNNTITRKARQLATARLLKNQENALNVLIEKLIIIEQSKLN